MEKKKIRSLRWLAEQAELPHTVVTRAIHGDAIPSPETVEALASFLELPLAEVYSLLGQDVSPEAAKWDPPGESALLSSEQREILEKLIKVMVKPANGQGRGRSAEDEDPVDREARHIRNESYHGSGKSERLTDDDYTEGYRLAASDDPQQGRKDRGAPPEA
jgi:hypothetical protein